eukprot:UN05112
MTNMEAIESGFGSAFKIAEEIPGNLRAFVHNTAANLPDGSFGNVLHNSFFVCLAHFAYFLTFIKFSMQSCLHVLFRNSSM